MHDEHQSLAQMTFSTYLSERDVELKKTKRKKER